MRKFLLMCCFLIGITAVCHAQGGGMMRMKPEERAKTLQTQLKLSDDQTAKLTIILKAQTTKMDSLRTAGADRAAMRPVMQATNDQIKAILTPDQAAAYQKMMDERRAKMQGGGNGN